MTKRYARSLSAATSSPFAMGVALAMLGATPAAAQDAVATQSEAEKAAADAAAAVAEVDAAGSAAAAASAPGTTDAIDGTIIVTGFRRSLESAINKKKNSEQVVESVSAEDIGKLPDASIGESIARLPGLTAQRLNGRANNISIRGFGPDFSTTLLNGREQTSTSDNRGIEFDQYPSEVVSRVDVYKTMTPNIIGQGLVGTVDVRTARPLDSKRGVFAIGLKGSKVGLGKLNSGSKEYGWRANATYIDQFADDRVGVALSASYTDEPYQVQEYNAWGFVGPADARIIEGNKSFVTSTQLKRLGLAGTLQADIGDDFRVTADAFYSDFDDDIIKRGIELPLGGSFGWTSAALSNPTVTDGTVTSGTFTNIEAVVNNHALRREAKLLSGGLNLAWDPGNGWKGSLDANHSRTDRSEFNFETNSGTGRGQGVGARDTLNFTCGTRGCVFDPTLNYSDPNLIQLTSPMGWGGVPGGQDGYYNNRIIDDRLTQFRGDLERELGGFLSSVKVGLAHTKRDKELTPDESYIVLASGASQQRVPDEFLLEPTQLDYIGLGPVISYDPFALLDAGIYRRVDNPDSTVDRKAYQVGEKIITGYLMVNIDQSIGTSRLTGNIGVQAVHTDQSSTGPVVNGATFGRATYGDKFWDVLPSMNLSLRTAGDIVVRMALARQMQRPRLDDMRVSFGYGYNTNNQRIDGGGGNPLLRPFRANAADLTIEKYFGIKGYLALQLFHKKLKNFIYGQTVPFDYEGLPISNAPASVIGPNGTVVAGVPGLISQPVNAKGGSIKGFELAGTLPFGEFVSAMDGFGITGGYGYTKSRVRPSPNEPFGDIPGYSKHVANGTLFFEKWGFSARASARYRSTFRGELSGFGGELVRRRAKGEKILDAQVGYDFQPGTRLEGMSVYLQGQNLTNEPFVTFQPKEPLRVIDYQRYGRRYQAGITYKF